MEAFASTFWAGTRRLLLFPFQNSWTAISHHVSTLLSTSTGSYFLRMIGLKQATVGLKHSSDSPIDEPGWRLQHLKTKEECRLKHELIDVWTIELPSKHAEGILRIVKDHLDGQDGLDLQHLRRFAKAKYLPAHVVNQHHNSIKDLFNVSQGWDKPPSSVIQPDITSVWQWSTGTRPRTVRPANLYLLICPTSVLPIQELEELLLQHTPFTSTSDSWAYPLEIKSVTVPRLPPTSAAQAAVWSEQYWPTFYRKTNPFGAHPATIQKAEEEMLTPELGNIGVQEAMELADTAAEKSTSSGMGVGTGCVIIERSEEGTEIVAVASDARYGLDPASREVYSSGSCQGNVMAHSVMRAIGFVGRKRLRVASHIQKKSAEKAESNFDRVGLIHDEKARDAFFLDIPVNDLEEEYFVQDNIKPDGYLCLKLEVFLTHEPCIMCCMALVHSRVGRVIFKHRMPSTGGLTAEIDSNDSGPVGLGYGLCWRKELNWQFMCWEYVLDDGLEEQRKIGEDSNPEPPPSSTSSASAVSYFPVAYVASPRQIDSCPAPTLTTSYNSAFQSVHV